MNKRTWLNFYILSHLSLFSRTVTRRWRHSGNTPRRERKSAVLEVCFTAIVGHTADAFIQSLLSSSSKSSQRFIFSLGSRTSEISFEYQPIYVFITFTHSRCNTRLLWISALQTLRVFLHRFTIRVGTGDRWKGTDRLRWVCGFSNAFYFFPS